MAPALHLKPGRRTLLTGSALGLAGLVASGCSLQIRSEPDPTIGDDTMLIAGDKGTPTFHRELQPVPADAAHGRDDHLRAVDLDQSARRLPRALARRELGAARSAADRHDVARRRHVDRWHPLTSDDVLYTFQMLKDFPANDTAGAWGRIDTIEASGNTITVTLLAADAPALPIVGKTMIIPEHIWSEIEDPGTWRNEEPVGSAPTRSATSLRCSTRWTATTGTGRPTRSISPTSSTPRPANSSTWSPRDMTGDTPTSATSRTPGWPPTTATGTGSRRAASSACTPITTSSPSGILTSPRDRACPRWGAERGGRRRGLHGGGQPVRHAAAQPGGAPEP